MNIEMQIFEIILGCGPMQEIWLGEEFTKVRKRLDGKVYLDVFGTKILVMYGRLHPATFHGCGRIRPIDHRLAKSIRKKLNGRPDL